MENDNKALIPVTPTTRSPGAFSRYSDSQDNIILHSLNMKLQMRVHTLENEVCRLKEEVRVCKTKTCLYESLTTDLAILRSQLDKTAMALLKKCEAYDIIKKENLKLQQNAVPTSSQKTPKKSTTTAQPGAKKKLEVYNDMMDTDVLSSVRRTGRPSMGSCGNLAKQSSTEEAMPSCLQPYLETAAPLRNRVLMKLHTLRSASTESLESVGRKSLKAQEIKQSKLQKPTKLFKPNLDTVTQPLKGTGIKAPVSARPALGQINGRVIKVNTTLQKSNSSCSTKSRPVFKH